MSMDAPGGSGRPAPSLSRCVAVDPATFASTCWGRSPVFSRAEELPNTAGFTDLLDPDDVDELLSRRGLRTPFLRVASLGSVLPASQFTGSGGAGAEVGDQVVDDKVMQLYADGATLVLQGLHRIWGPVADFARELGAELARPLQVNAYLTPPGSQGFGVHYDTHDVFVLQVDGHKRWRVHPPVLADPLERQPWGGRADEVAAVADGEPAIDVTLGPGDALYLPRGWLHSAAAQQRRSLHLTVGVRALTRYALVEELLGLAAGDARLRATLPYGLDVSDPAQLSAELAETVSTLRGWLSTVDPAEVADRLRERDWPAARPAPIRPLAQLDAAERLSPDDQITARGGLRWRLADDGAGQVRLRLAGRTLRFPAYCAPAVKAALGGAPVRVADLPGLDDDADRLTLARRLLREALAVPAGQPVPDRPGTVRPSA